MPPPTELDALVVTETYSQDTRPVLAFIIVSSLLAAILLPLLGLLIAQSTSRSRRTTFFALNVIAVCLGILDGILCIHLSVTSLLSPFSTLNPVENFMYTFLSVWVPWITEAILLFRVVVVYRSSFACLSQMLPLLVFPIIVKVARAVCNIIFLVHRKPSSWQPNLHAFANAQTLDTWPVKVTWVLEFVDNLYISFLFLWRLWAPHRTALGAGLIKLRGDSKESFTMTDRLRTLFWIASTNFVFPLIFGICSVTLLFAGHLQAAKVFKMTDTFVAIICTVLATVWATTTSHRNTAVFVSQPITFNRAAEEMSIVVTVDRELASSTKRKDVTL